MFSKAARSWSRTKTQWQHCRAAGYCSASRDSPASRSKISPPRMRACLANERWIKTNKSNTCKGGIIPKWPCRYHAAFKQTRQDKTRHEGFRLPRLSFPSLCRECGGWGLAARGSGSVRLRYKRHWTSKADADASGWAFRPRPLAAISSLRSLAALRNLVDVSGRCGAPGLSALWPTFTCVP